MLFEDIHDEYVQKGYFVSQWISANWYAELPIPYKDGKLRGRIYFVVGMPGTGKSVFTRLLAWYVSVYLLKVMKVTVPVYIWDHGGRDHAYGYHANARARNLPPETWASGIPGRYYFCPSFNSQGQLNGRKKNRHERYYLPNFNKYDINQFVSMGFTWASAKNLIRIMRNDGPFKSLKQLHQHIERTPSLRKDYKETLLRDFENIVMSRRCWRMDDKYDVSIEELLKSGENAIFSFSDDKIVARAEIDWFWRQLRTLIDQQPNLLRPFLFFEEAQDIFEAKDDTVTGSLEEAALKLRKGGIPVCLTMPTLEGVSPKVASVARDWIIGAIDGESRNLIKKYTGSQLIWEKIGQLRSDTTGSSVQNDLLYYVKDKKRGVVFTSFECPQEFNRRI